MQKYTEAAILTALDKVNRLGGTSNEDLLVEVAIASAALSQ